MNAIHIESRRGKQEETDTAVYMQGGEDFCCQTPGVQFDTEKENTLHEKKSATSERWLKAFRINVGSRLKFFKLIRPRQGNKAPAEMYVMPSDFTIYSLCHIICT